MRTSSIGLLSALVLSVGLVALPGVGRADTFQLTSDHCTGNCLPAGTTSAGTVTVTGGSGTLVFSVSLNSGFSFVHTGFDTDFGFNLAGNPTITFSGVTSGFAPTGTNPQTAGSLHMDGTGFFEYGVTCTACGSGGSNPQAGPLNFTITGAGLTLASLEQNAALQFFAVDLLGNGNTGAVDASTRVSAVPLPPAALLFGTALVGLGVLGRRRRKDAVAA